jgi:hypothetical protein
MLYAGKNNRHDEDANEPPRVFGRSKGNIGRPVNAFGYRIVDGILPVEIGMEKGRVEWLGEIEGNIQDIVNDAEKPADEEVKKTKLAEARDWLRNTLVVGSLPATVMKERALAAGISEGTLKNAVKDFIVSTKDGIGAWHWSLGPNAWTQKRGVNR